MKVILGIKCTSIIGAIWFNYQPNSLKYRQLNSTGCLWILNPIYFHVLAPRRFASWLCFIIWSGVSWSPCLYGIMVWFLAPRGGLRTFRRVVHALYLLIIIIITVFYKFYRISQQLFGCSISWAVWLENTFFRLKIQYIIQYPPTSEHSFWIKFNSWIAFLKWKIMQPLQNALSQLNASSTWILRLKTAVTSSQICKWC